MTFHPSQPKGGVAKTAGIDIRTPPFAQRDRGMLSQAWRRFRRHRLAMVSALMLAAIGLLAVGAPAFAPIGPYRMDGQQLQSPPNSRYIVGTDPLGRDVWARLIYAGRASLSVGLGAVVIYIAIGTTLGAISGYYGGPVDMVIQRLTDIVMSFPSLLIIIALVALLGPSLYNVVGVLGFLGWPGVCRIVRGEFLSLRERDFVTAAHCVGASDFRIIFRHILPNVVAPIIVAGTFGVASAIITETSLSFLGLGVQPPTPSWGNMMNEAISFTVLESLPWIWLPPGLMTATCVLAINFMGDGLRDALDPRMTL